MKLLESTKNIIDSDKNSKNVPRLENVEVVLVHYNTLEYYLLLYQLNNMVN